MAKYVLIYLSVLMLLVFVYGCPPAEPGPVETTDETTVETADETTVETADETTVETADEHVDGASVFNAKCSYLLTNYVSDKGMVNYRLLKRKKSELNSLLAEFAALDADVYNLWSRDDKIAFWLNVYNLQLLKIIVDNYPIETSRFFMVFWPPTSIRHIDKKIGGIGKQKFIVMDEEFTLDEVERRFFRRQFAEPLAFLALSTATVSGPFLRNEPYYGSRLYAQLNDQAAKFLSNPKAFRIDREEKNVYLSAIFRPKWFGNEFISKYGTDKRFKDQEPPVRAVLNFVKDFVSEADVSFLVL